MEMRGWPGPGPVFASEWLTASRRWQGYALRSLLVLLLLLGLSGVWLGGHDGAGELSVRQQAEIGRAFYAVTTLILLGLVGLATPIVWGVRLRRIRSSVMRRRSGIMAGSLLDDRRDCPFARSGR